MVQRIQQWREQMVPIRLQIFVMSSCQWQPKEARISLEAKELHIRNPVTKTLNAHAGNRCGCYTHVDKEKGVERKCLTSFLLFQKTWFWWWPGPMDKADAAKYSLLDAAPGSQKETCRLSFTANCCCFITLHSPCDVWIDSQIKSSLPFEPDIPGRCDDVRIARPGTDWKKKSNASKHYQPDFSRMTTFSLLDDPCRR